MEFMGISIGILALVCTLILLFGAQRTRKMLGWGFGLVIFGGLALATITGAWITYDHDGGQVQQEAKMATPLGILTAPPPANSYPTEILVERPDKRTFRFAAGTEADAIHSYMKTQYGGQGTPRGDCWAKEPGPWCGFRPLK